MAHKRMGKLFFIGLGSVFVGSLLLLLTTGILPSIISIWPGVLVLSGLYLVYRGYMASGSEGAVFVGFFLLMCGIALVLLNTIMTWAVFGRMWPLFIMALAVALIFYGIQKPVEVRAAYIIPGAVLTAMSVIFLLFSLGVVNMNFTRFMSRWWPLTIILLGIAVLLQNALKNQGNKS